MDNENIGLIMAMGNELGPFLTGVGPVCTDTVSGSTIHSFRVGKHSLSAVQSGMGIENATQAARALVDRCKPDLLINAGFAGSITPESAVGDIVLADRILLYKDGRMEEGELVEASLPVTAAGLINVPPRQFKVLHGSFVTAAGIRSKGELAAALPHACKVAVVDMETAAVARIATERGISFLGIRAVSDGFDEEIGFSIEEIADASMRVSAVKVLGTIIRKPWIIPQMVRLARNSKQAGANLAAALRLLLTTL